MKNQRIFSSIILIGFGLFYLGQLYQLSLFANLYTWPSLLIMIGIAFLYQGYGNQEYESILPGVILTGFGIHFHIMNALAPSANSNGVFMLIIALAFLLRYQKTKTGLLVGLTLLAVSFFLLFTTQVVSWINTFHIGILSSVISNWPFLLILIGIIVFVKK